MKKVFIILVMLLAAAATFSQTLRRPANSNETAGNRMKESVSTGSSSSVSNSDRSRQLSTERQALQHNQKESRNNTSGYSRDASQRQTTVTSNDRENVSRPRTGNIPAQKNPAGGVTHNVPARHDGAVHQGNSRQTGNTVYHSPRKSNGNREVAHHYSQPPQSREYRSYHHPYRKPVHVSIFWTPEMQFEYTRIYPMVSYWHYPVGCRIETISAYDALFYSGEVVNVYGQVYEVYYSKPTDAYILYFGAYYPYHDFAVVIPGNIARRFSNRPERYFEFEHVMVTGLVTMYYGVPEIYIDRTYQINPY